MSDILQRLALLRLVPIVVMDKAEHAASFGEVLAAGGLPVAEVTFRTPAAEQSVRMLANRGDLVVGAGTILTTEQADRAIDAGAQFLVAPGTNPKVVERAVKRGVPMMPGVATPSEIELAMSLGADSTQVFPGRNDGRRRRTQSIRRPVSRRAVHSHRRHHARTAAALPEVEERRRVRWFVDGSSRILGRRPIRCHRRARRGRKKIACRPA